VPKSCLIIKLSSSLSAAKFSRSEFLVFLVQSPLVSSKALCKSSNHVDSLTNQQIVTAQASLCCADSSHPPCQPSRQRHPQHPRPVQVKILRPRITRFLKCRLSRSTERFLPLPLLRALIRPSLRMHPLQKENQIRTLQVVRTFCLFPLLVWFMHTLPQDKASSIDFVFIFLAHTEASQASNLISPPSPLPSVQSASK
jgi:hypothetical protein